MGVYTLELSPYVLNTHKLISTYGTVNYTFTTNQDRSG